MRNLFKKGLLLSVPLLMFGLDNQASAAMSPTACKLYIAKYSTSLEHMRKCANECPPPLNATCAAKVAQLQPVRQAPPPQVVNVAPPPPPPPVVNDEQLPQREMQQQDPFLAELQNALARPRNQQGNVPPP